MANRDALPGWEECQLATVPGICRMLYIYDTLEVDPALIGAAFPALERARVLPSWPVLRLDTLPFELAPPPDGWAVCGLQGVRSGRDAESEHLWPGTSAWSLIVEWNSVQSAWHALLAGQETLHQQTTSLMPECILPAMFLARMADVRLERDIQSVAAAWVPCFAQAHTRLLPLMIGLFQVWAQGSSNTDKRDRRFLLSPQPSLQPEQAEALSQWEAMFGTLLLNQVRKAERPMPVIMRALDMTSTELWVGGHTGIFGDHHTQLIEALLPIALWQPRPPGPKNPHPDRIASLEALRRVWVRWR